MYLTPDLRENGKYVVIDYNQDMAKRLINGDALVQEFDQRTAELLQFYQNYCEDRELTSGRIYVMFDPRKENPNPKNAAQRAIEKMFLL